MNAHEHVRQQLENRADLLAEEAREISLPSREQEVLLQHLANANSRLEEKGVEIFERNRSFREGAEELTGSVYFLDSPQSDPWFVIALIEVRRPGTGKLGFQTLLIPRKGRAVCVVPIVNERYFLMARQYRLAANDFTNEFPRGWIRNESDDPEDAARQRLISEIPRCQSLELVSLRMTSPRPIRDNTGLYRGAQVYHFVVHLRAPFETSQHELQTWLNREASPWVQARVASIDGFEDLVDRGEAVGDIHSITGLHFAIRREGQHLKA